MAKELDVNASLTSKMPCKHLEHFRMAFGWCCLPYLAL
jgi:hypothetical protein